MHVYLYRAAPGLAPISKLTASQRHESLEPLGSIDSIKQALGELFADLQWQKLAAGWSGGRATCELPYVDILLPEEEPGVCTIVILEKPALSEIRMVMHAMDLNHACVPESGILIDTNAAADDAGHYPVLKAGRG
jgi:hypothetical protein